MKVDFEELCKELEALIPAGKSKEAIARLSPLKTMQVPREYRIKLAALSRRAYAPELALYFLNPIVRPKSRSQTTATEAEKAEYAASLVRLGALTEGVDLLRRVVKAEAPEALLFEAFAQFAKWNYSASIPLLSQYIEMPSLSDFQRLIGKINLAAALVHVKKIEMAFPLLEEIKIETKTRNQLLFGNACLLQGQIAVDEKQWLEAEKILQEAHSALKTFSGLDELFVRKRLAILNLIKSNGSKRSIEQLESIRSEARTRSHWETVRDCDRYEAVVLRDKKLFAHVYFGTPQISFRKLLLSEFGSNQEFTDHYEWQILGKKGKVLNFATSEGRDSLEIKPGQLIHRLVTLLTSDFYRPFRVAQIHSALFEGEFYNPTTSPLRVHQAFHRMRNWMSKKKLPLIVQEVRGEYKLASKRPIGIAVPEVNEVRSPEYYHAEHLRSHFTKPFTAAEACKLLGYARGPGVRLLKTLVGKGELVRLGRSSDIRYAFPVEVVKKAA